MSDISNQNTAQFDDPDNTNILVELEAISDAKPSKDTLKIEVLDVEKFVKANALHEVTDPLLFTQMGVPTASGLLSYEIFGAPGTRDRQQRWAFIDLAGKYFNPIVFYNLTRLKRVVRDIIMHDTWGYFIDGDIKGISDEEYEKLKGNKKNIVGKGLSFLIDNIDKLKLTRHESMERDIRSDVLKLDDNVRFLTKCHVIPAIHRDVDFNSRGGNMSDHESNRWYGSLIRNSSLIRSGVLGTEQAMDIARAKIQLTLVDIYRNSIEKIPKSDGNLQKNVYGKNIDYSGFGVLSAADYMNIDKPSDLRVSVERSGIPLSHCVSYYFPFIEAWIESYMSNMLSGAKKIVVMDAKGKKKKLLDIHPLAMEDYTGDAYLKRVEKFNKSAYTRFDPLTIKAVDDDNKIHYVDIGFMTTNAALTMNSDTFAEDVKQAHTDKMNVRPMTWTDLFYMAAYNVVQADNKHIRITRYPLKDHLNTIITKVFILSTIDTEERTIGGMVYPYYPKIDLTLDKDNISSSFLQTIQLSEEFLDRLGGDHDGDTSTELAVWSQEANKECDMQMHSKRNMFDLNGNSVFSIHNGTLLTFAYLTK